MGPPPRLVVMALVAAGVVLVAALFAAIAFKIVKSRKALEKEKNDDKCKFKPKPTDANWEWPIQSSMSGILVIPGAMSVSKEVQKMRSRRAALL
jgi:hypothetical protein